MARTTAIIADIVSRGFSFPIPGTRATRDIHSQNAREGPTRSQRVNFTSTEFCDLLITEKHNQLINKQGNDNTSDIHKKYK